MVISNCQDLAEEQLLTHPASRLFRGQLFAERSVSLSDISLSLTALNLCTNESDG